jgi:hypothetical protein
LKVPGVLLHNEYDTIKGKKGAYIIDYFGQHFYVDIKNKFASRIAHPDNREQNKDLMKKYGSVDSHLNILIGKNILSVNEAYIVTYAKKKGEKPASAAFQLRGSALSFERDLKKDGYITMVTQKKVKGIDESLNEANPSLNKKVKNT